MHTRLPISRSAALLAWQIACAAVGALSAPDPSVQTAAHALAQLLRAHSRRSARGRRDRRHVAAAAAQLALEVRGAVWTSAVLSAIPATALGRDAFRRAIQAIQNIDRPVGPAVAVARLRRSGARTITTVYPPDSAGARRATLPGYGDVRADMRRALLAAIADSDASAELAIAIAGLDITICGPAWVLRLADRCAADEYRAIMDRIAGLPIGPRYARGAADALRYAVRVAAGTATAIERAATAHARACAARTEHDAAHRAAIARADAARDRVHAARAARFAASADQAPRLDLPGVRTVRAPEQKVPARHRAAMQSARARLAHSITVVNPPPFEHSVGPRALLMTLGRPTLEERTVVSART